MSRTQISTFPYFFPICPNMPMYLHMRWKFVNGMEKDRKEGVASGKVK